VAEAVAHKLATSLRPWRAVACCSIAALLAFFACRTLSSAAADGETRTISFHHIHTNEDLTVTYKRNGRYDEEALNQINSLLRDWRVQEPIKMDPHVIDLLWEVHREVGAKGPIWVVCGYRSPGTNAMLRARSSGVARSSQHMNGKAVDFYIPGVPLEQLQAAGLRAQRGGVGIYPASWFVHMDTGSVRHWPRMPEAQMARILSKGQLGSQNASDDGSVSTVAMAQAVPSRTSSFLSRLFGSSKDEEDHDETAAVPVGTASKRSAAAASAAAAKPVPTTTTVPVPAARPARAEGFQVASAASIPAPPPPKAAATAAIPVVPAGSFEVASASSTPVRPAQAASLFARASGPSAAEPAMAGSATAAAGGAPWPLANRAESEPVPSALAYAAQPMPIASVRPLPMGSLTSRPAPVPQPEKADTTVAAKRTDDSPVATAPKPKDVSVVQIGDSFNDPWMRAMIVSPSAQSFMKTTLFGAQDLRSLVPHMHKPASAVMMTFAADPNEGISTDKFGGSAVVFISTISFGKARTAALR
jgi:uncharacterized protein YcbK (DUF882 family)